MSKSSVIFPSRTVIRRVVSLAAAVSIVFGGAVSMASVSQAEGYADYLNLPLTNRNAAQAPGGVNAALPTDLPTLERLLTQARNSGVSPTSYAALLYQYRLVDVTQTAGIDLASWNPRAGVAANRANLTKSYRYYEDLQLERRELQWAGMAGFVGADFGGGLIDFEMAAGVFDLPQIQQTASAIVTAANAAAGPQAVDALPEGLRALARVGSTITADDLHVILGDILVMQKNIFSDLMPMHRAYVTEGLPALEEMERAGLFGEDIMNAWRDVASQDPERISRGNATMLQREQGLIVRDQWDAVRNYKGDVGMAVTYLSTVAAAPSVAGVTPPRSINPIKVSSALPDGRTVTLTTPLPAWNWSIYQDRWDYISDQLLPKYKDMVENNWPALEAGLRIPYDIQMESHRPLNNVPQLLQSALDGIKVEVN